MLVAGLVAAYVWLVRPLEWGVTLRRKHVACFGAGMVLLWAFADWPVHDLSERYLFSVHMVQHTVFSLIAPPLVLLGLPAPVLDRLTSAAWLRRVLRRLCRPLVAALLFNGVIAISHWPSWVDLTLRSELAHFLAHLVLWTTATVMWLPVVNPGVRGLPSLSRPAKIPYLFLQSIVPTIPASFLAFADDVLYKAYAAAPRITSMSAVEDQQLAGGIMKVGGTAILWGVIIAVFFRWYAEHERTGSDTLTWEEVSAEFDRTPAPAERTPA